MEIKNIILEKEWETISYTEALELQEKLCGASEIGFLFFSPKPTLTSGIRSNINDLLCSKEECLSKNIDVINTKRGGQWTYHGPGQVVMFPFGSLEKFGYSSRSVSDFICDFQKEVKKFAGINDTSDIQCNTNKNISDSIWLNEKKIGSIGMGFHRNSISHGIALNLDFRVMEGFKLINPCGISSETIGYLFESKKNLLQIKDAAYSFFK